MSTDKRTAGARTTNVPGMEKLLEQYGSGPIQLAGADNAFYERHLVFDNVAALTAAGPRERFEAIARSVRDVLSQRWVRTEETYERANASVFISRWDAAVTGKVPDALSNKLGIAVAVRTYKACRTLLGSARWQRVYSVGACPQRLLWASTGTKDPRASDVLYIKALAAPFTVNTMPEGTLKALADHGELGGLLPADGGDCEEVLARFAKAGIDIDALAARLQDEGAKAFVKSWNELMEVLASKSAVLEKAS